MIVAEDYGEIVDGISVYGNHHPFLSGTGRSEARIFTSPREVSEKGGLATHGKSREQGYGGGQHIAIIEVTIPTRAKRKIIHAIILFTNHIERRLK